MATGGRGDQCRDRRDGHGGPYGQRRPGDVVQGLHDAVLGLHELRNGPASPQAEVRRGYKAIVTFDGRAAQIPIKGIGPWNTYDDYWDPIAKRTMCKSLPRGKPEAEAAYCNNYNRGKDEFGREVLNPAGTDPTPAAAARIGLRRYQNAWVSVRMPWLKR